MTVNYRRRRKEARQGFLGICDTKKRKIDTCPNFVDLDAVIDWILEDDESR